MPMLVQILMYYVLMKQQSLYYKRHRSIFVVQHVSDDCFTSKRLGRTLCTVQRNQNVYCRVMQLDDYMYFVKSYVLLSNKPFHVHHAPGFVLEYDGKNQVLMPYSTQTANYFNFEHWTEV